MKKLPSKVEINKVYSYNPNDGVFTRVINSSQHRVGHTVKSSSNGYVSITINGSKFLAHRIAWMLINDDPCGLQIDHINHNRSDNSIKNLRLATNTENHKNSTKQKITTPDSSAFIGVILQINLEQQ